MGRKTQGTLTGALMGQVRVISARQAAEKVLARAGKPLPTSDIVDAVLRTRGVNLGGKTPEATIERALSREHAKPDGIFRRTRPGHYTLRRRKARA